MPQTSAAVASPGVGRGDGRWPPYGCGGPA